MAREDAGMVKVMEMEEAERLSFWEGGGPVKLSLKGWPGWVVRAVVVRAVVVRVRRKRDRQSILGLDFWCRW